MKLTIINRKNLDLDLFCEWLTEKLKDQFRDNIDPYKLEARDLILNQAVTYTLKQTLSAEVVLKLAINKVYLRKGCKV